MVAPIIHAGDGGWCRNRRYGNHPTQTGGGVRWIARHRLSEINEIQDKATKDLGFPVAGQAMGYGECLSKLLNQNDQYEIAEWYYHDPALLEPAKVFQPIDTQRIKDWDKVTNLTKTGKLTPEASVGQGAAPYKWMWCDVKGAKVQGPSRYIIMTPAWHNAARSSRADAPQAIKAKNRGPGSSLLVPTATLTA